MLDEFNTWLNTSSLTQKTIERHTLNARIFINDYLVRYEPIEAHEGFSQVGSFIGYCVKVGIISGKDSFMKMSGSVKKFHTFMFETGRISAESFDEMKEQMKEESEEWRNNDMY